MKSFHPLIPKLQFIIIVRVKPSPNSPTVECSKIPISPSSKSAVKRLSSVQKWFLRTTTVPIYFAIKQTLAGFNVSSRDDFNGGPRGRRGSSVKEVITRHSIKEVIPSPAFAETLPKMHNNDIMTARWTFSGYAWNLEIDQIIHDFRWLWIYEQLAFPISWNSGTCNI